MLDSIALEEIGVERLRLEGKRLGIQNAAQLGKDDLIVQIRQKLSEQSRPSKWPIRLSVISLTISGLTAIFTLWQCLATMQGTNVAIESLASSQKDRTKQEWQRAVIYRILSKGFSEGRVQPMSFDEIKKDYIVAAQAVKEVDLTRDDLSDVALQKILLELMSIQVVHQSLPGGKYVAQAAWVDQRAGRFFEIENVKYALIHTLATESGKWSPSELRSRLDKNSKLSPEEFDALIIELVASKAIIIEDNKVYGAANPPAKK